MTSFAKLALASMTSLALFAAAAPASAEGKPLEVKRLVLAHGIEGHEPQEASSSFKPSDDRVYAFVELSNLTGEKKGIQVVFEPPSGPALAPIPLEIKESARFRTWAFTRQAHEAGEWTVVVRDAKHRVLARQTFVIAK